MERRAGLLPIVAGFLMLSVAAQEGRGDAELVITPLGESHTRPLDSSYVFSCSVNGLSPDIDPILKWIDKEGIEITSTTGRMYIESDGPQTLKLYITQIENKDAGRFTCQGTVSGSRIERHVTLLIYKDITFDHAPSPQHPAIYTDALIECRVSGQPIPQVSWRYRGQTITTGGRYIQDAYGLHVSNITLEDDGRYTCRAEVPNDGRFDKRDIDIYVHIPPKMLEGPGQADGIENQEVSLTCEANGHPAPKYEFYKDGNENPVTDSDTVKVDRDKGVIDFKPLKREHQGDYRCVAYNDVGQADSTGNLHVLIKPHILRYLNVTTQEGAGATLECHTEGEPIAKISFQKVGNNADYQEGENEGGRVTVRSDGSVSRLTISNANPDDTSNYTCKAVNDAGEAAQNGTITVQYKPFFDQVQDPVYSWPGKMRNISCVVRAEPEPAIKWYRYEDENEIRDNGTYHVYHMYKSSNLQILVREIDQDWIFGEYTCLASNQLGQGSQKILLKRALAPDAPKEVTVKLSSPTTLELAIQPPENDGGVAIFGYRIQYDSYVTDFKIGQPIILENLRASTTYIFTVHAQNEVGIGDPIQFSHTTEDIRVPYPIVIVSDPNGLYPYDFNINWERPRTGGLVIIQYEIKFRRVQKLSTGGDNSIVKPEEDWTRRLVDDDPNSPMLYYKLEGLMADSTYEVEVRAKNNVGWSLPNSPYTFYTAKGPAYALDDQGSDEGSGSGAVRSSRMATGWVMFIVIFVFLIFLVIVDVSCCFMNKCGVTMCLWTRFCARKGTAAKEKVMEAGESERIMGSHDMEEAKAAEEQEVMAQSEEALQDTPPTPPPVLEEDENQSSRKSARLSQNDDPRWKDVVKELERELSEKKPEQPILIEDLEQVSPPPPPPPPPHPEDEEDKEALKEEILEEEANETSPLTETKENDVAVHEPATIETEFVA